MYRTEPVFAAALDECAAVLESVSEVDPRWLVTGEESPSGDPEDLLTQTRITQPVLFSFEYAMAKLWAAWGIKPEAAVGHSIGEFVAACLGGVFTLEDALGVVAARGEIMQRQPVGSMLSVRAPADCLRSYLEQTRRWPPSIARSCVWRLDLPTLSPSWPVAWRATEY